MNELSPPPRLLPWAPELNGEAPHAASGEADATWSGRRPTGETAPGTGPAARAGEAPPEPGLLDWLRLPLRLAARQLRADRAKLATAIAGVMFAAVLVFMQLGFRSALFDSATALLSGMRADLFLIHPMTQASFRPEPLPRARAWQTLADAEVEQAVPIYLAQATLRHPTEGTRRAVQLIGLDAAAGAVAFTGLSSLTEPLTRPDTFAFDSRSRPEFGPLPRLFDERGPYEVQIGSRMLTLVGVVEIGPSFGADGNAVLSETNFRRVVSRNPAATDLVALRLKPGTDIAAVQARLRAMLPADVLVLTHAQLVAGERAYWENSTPIGFIFVFGSVMGLVVGMVIVYQILFADIAGHLGEYATLKAMGYSNGYLSRVVMGAALILALVGFVPGLGVSWLLYDFVGGATFLPLDMYPARAGMVFALILGMCVIAGLLAMRKLRDANPADMF